MIASTTPPLPRVSRLVPASLLSLTASATEPTRSWRLAQGPLTLLLDSRSLTQDRIHCQQQFETSGGRPRNIHEGQLFVLRHLNNRVAVEQLVSPHTHSRSRRVCGSFCLRNSYKAAAQPDS
ncbi:hypothetical protein G6O67_002740 [Ophiocordyceps sinensis]|uniref:Uncharacterized protein n=1 Tax=Ophiocordyceps sinensis TaxID=72228 RepID=A0A8H4PUW0_9HYPO|nr:hypothetical protein G6O67_002740 [Ophiocordyceps sinensis]